MCGSGGSPKWFTPCSLISALMIKGEPDFTGSPKITPPLTCSGSAVHVNPLRGGVCEPPPAGGAVDTDRAVTSVTAVTAADRSTTSVTEVVAERQAQRAAAYARRQESRTRVRNQFAEARAVGLRHRHTAKTSQPNGTDRERTTP